MVISIKWVIISIGFCVIIVINSCDEKGLGCADTTYNFQIGESVNPDKDSVRVGDTLYLKVNTLTKLKDLQSGNVVDYSNVGNLGNVITILKILPAKKDIGAISNFHLLMLKGQKGYSIDPSSQQVVLFGEENGNYVFNMAVVPKDTGRYVLTISDAANVYRKNDKCTKANFKVNFEDTKQHLYFNKIIAPDIDLLPGEGVYLFKVY